MAREKKEAVLTPEERLQAALVPDWEWPYKLPENWCWTYLGVVSEIVMGQSPAGKSTTNDSSYMPLIGGAADMGKLYPQVSRFTKTPTKRSQTDDVILSIRATLGRPIFSDGIYCLGRGVVAFRSSIVTKEFLRYFFIDQENYLYQNATGTTFAQVDSKTLKSMPFPLPPFHEQRRIVRRVESLFTKLDEAKEKAQAVVDSFEIRKAAILHKAFTGELTAKWREEHGVRMESWEKRRINELARPRAGYAFDSKKFSNTGYQVVRMGNLYGETLDLFRKPVFISEDDVDDSILNRALIKDGDILITLTGTKYKRDYGYAVCVSSPNKLLVNQRILCLTPFACVERNYLLYYLKSNLFRDVFFSCETGGVNQGNVSSKFVENIEIPIPTFDEQLEITTVLDRTLAHEQQAKEAAEAVLDQIDLMKKSILARAFRGELGTNDPSEESAVELLRQIIEQEDGDVIRPKAKAKRIAIPAEIKPLLSGANEEAIVKLLLKAAPQSVSTQTVMSISKKKFELMDALRNLEKKQIVSKSDSGEYSLVR